MDSEIRRLKVITTVSTCRARLTPERGRRTVVTEEITGTLFRGKGSRPQDSPSLVKESYTSTFFR